MAKFKSEIPNDIIKELEDLKENCTAIFGEMTKAGAEEVKKNVLANMTKSFDSTKSLERGLKITKIYKTPSDDGINTFVGFYGYNEEKVPIPLIAQAREYGTSRGEKKKPFFRKSFKKKDIERVMKQVQDKYIKGD